MRGKTIWPGRGIFDETLAALPEGDRGIPSDWYSKGVVGSAAHARAKSLP